MEKTVYCIEDKTTHYYFQGYEVGPHFPREYHPPKELEIALEEREENMLVPLVDEWYEGGTQAHPYEEKDGTVYFKRNCDCFSWELRLPVLKRMGRIVVLDQNSAEFKEEYYDRAGNKWILKKDWGPVDHDPPRGIRYTTIREIMRG